ncbi:MAG: methionine adenosyltransferase [Armatimonadota bacterium]
MNIHVMRSERVDVEHRHVELVERKGLGHPDTLSDRAAEELSIALSRYYLEHFGAILHHNTDKVLLVGGQARAEFGRGEILEPIYLLLSGRATTEVGGEPVPVGEIAVRHTAEWMRESLPHLPLPSGMIIDYRVKASSPDLVAVFRQPGVPLAGDSSFAVAYAPMSDLECLVSNIELYLNSPEVKRRYPMLGQDIKVMGVRIEDRIELLLAIAFIAGVTSDLETYLQVKREVCALVVERAAGCTRRQVTVAINTADRPEEGIVYLTATGTSAEQGDDGQVGRGNRANGLITPMRTMTLEAAAGKNPVSHAGKIYQVYAQLMVERICERIPEVRAAVCVLLSRIGAPINAPQAISIRVESEVSEATLRDPITEIAAGVLDEWAEIRDGFMQRRWRLF